MTVRNIHTNTRVRRTHTTIMYSVHDVTKSEIIPISEEIK